MAGQDWSDGENDALVAEYFAMLRRELAGQPFVKANHNRAVRERIARSQGAVEFKLRNVSAVLMAMGEPWITGYRPAVNFQDRLAEAVMRWLDAHPGWMPPVAGLAEAQALYFAPPPTLRNAPDPVETERLDFIARRFDVAGRDARNREIGRRGEALVFAHERARLARERPELVAEVRWISRDEGDGAGYDIASVDLSGGPRRIEVKATNGWERTPFHLTRREVAAAGAVEGWSLVRVWNMARQARAFEIHPPLVRHVALIATDYEARFH